MGLSFLGPRTLQSTPQVEFTLLLPKREVVESLGQTSLTGISGFVRLLIDCNQQGQKETGGPGILFRKYAEELSLVSL